MCDISVARVDETPTTKQLQYLKGNGKTVRFMKAVEGEWRRLADLLGLGESVDAINETAFGKSDKACRQVMVTWLKGAHRAPVTWATLLKVLGEMERPDIKKDLETALSGHTGIVSWWIMPSLICTSCCVTIDNAERSAFL